MNEYKSVPIEPTEEMLEAGHYAMVNGCHPGGVYADMLAAAPAAQEEPVGWQFYQDGKWWNGDDRIKDHRKNTEEDGYPVRDVYTIPQTSPVVAQMVEALKGMIKGYMGLLEAGRDRITSLGGDCDSVATMEQTDPWLRDARKALAIYCKEMNNDFSNQLRVADKRI